MNARTGGDGAEAVQTPPHPRERSDSDVRVAGDVPECDDQIHVRVLECRPEREVTHPAAVGGDSVSQW